MNAPNMVGYHIQKSKQISLRLTNEICPQPQGEHLNVVQKFVVCKGVGGSIITKPTYMA